jgi:hypothetical protein
MFEYGIAHLNEFKVTTAESSGRGRRKKVVHKILLGDSVVYPTERFFKSLYKKFKINANIFKYFSHEEVFKRLTEKCKTELRYCLDVREPEHPTLLAVTGPQQPYIPFDELCDLLRTYNSQYMSYANGIISSIHVPKIPNNVFINEQECTTRFAIYIPVDGYGKPAVYVALQFLQDSELAIAFTPRLRSQLTVGSKGDTINFALERALSSFNDEDNYAALQNRYRAAADSWASIKEAMWLSKILIRIYNNGQMKGVKRIVIGGETGNTWDDVPIMKTFAEITGNLNREYGLASIDSLSSKKQRALPACCTVFDLLSFAAKVASQHVTPEGKQQLYHFIGHLIQDEYDLEGTKDEYASWKDFLVLNDEAAQAKVDMESIYGE